MGEILGSQRVVRCAISGKMAFPVGYEVLEAHFGSTLGWATALSSFRERPVYFASEFDRILRAREPYEIFSLEWQGRERSIYEPGRWHFHICPVARALKKAARTSLEECFAKLVDFMVRAPIHDHYANRSAAIFDPVEKNCRVEQWHEI